MYIGNLIMKNEFSRKESGETLSPKETVSQVRSWFDPARRGIEGGTDNYDTVSRGEGG
jgi:hypothetical protein